MKRRAQCGFTLIEVLVASVLIASVFVAAMSLMSQSLRNLARMEPHEKAIVHAREKMTEELLRDALRTERTGGQWDDGYRWQVEIVPEPPVAGAPQQQSWAMFDVRVQIAWGNVMNPRTYEVQTTRWAPVAQEKAQ